MFDLYFDRCLHNNQFRICVQAAHFSWGEENRKTSHGAFSRNIFLGVQCYSTVEYWADWQQGWPARFCRPAHIDPEDPKIFQKLQIFVTGKKIFFEHFSHIF